MHAGSGSAWGSFRRSPRARRRPASAGRWSRGSTIALSRSASTGGHRRREAIGLGPVYMHRELRRTGVMLELFHLEYLEEHPDGLRYRAFCDSHRRWVSTAGLARAGVGVLRGRHRDHCPRSARGGCDDGGPLRARRTAHVWRDGEALRYGDRPRAPEEAAGQGEGRGRRADRPTLDPGAAAQRDVLLARRVEHADRPSAGRSNGR